MEFMGGSSRSPADRPAPAAGAVAVVAAAVEAAVVALLTDRHPATRYRVLGTLSQFKPFADTFSCPAGSRMNPPSKCDLW